MALAAVLPPLFSDSGIACQRLVSWLLSKGGGSAWAVWDILVS